MGKHFGGPQSVFAGAVALLLLAGIPVQAANECKVEYGYHTGSGFYLEQAATLKRIDCLAQVSAGFGTPEQLIEALRNAVPLEQIARQLRQQFNKTDEEVASALKAVGFSAAEVESVMKIKVPVPLPSKGIVR